MAAKAKKLPTFDGLTAYDFELFTREKQRSENYDAGRLAVKRKLAAIGKHVDAAMAEAGVPLVSKTSLHNPCRYNSNRVRMIKVYLARTKAARAPIKKILGPALSGDLDPHYHNTQIWLKVEAPHVEIAVAVHPAAWWDAQHVVKSCQSEEGRRALVEAMRPLPDHALQVHNMAPQDCSTLYADDLARIIRGYKAGEHWLYVLRRIAAEDVVEAGPDFLATAKEELLRLLPVYELLAWSP